MDSGFLRSGTYLLNTDLTDILMGMEAIVSPSFPMFGSMT